MLWYGLIYYTLFITLVTITSTLFFKLLTFRTYSNQTLTNIILNICTTVTTVLSLIFFSNSSLVFSNYYTILLTADDYFGKSKFGFNYLDIYYYPFIYIFILITLLSIITCLSYPVSEITSFLFFTVTILVSGFLFFSTNNLFLFFFAYELLLLPSFFILYKYAKTRRAIEAAYLMFFWTQFGAFFLILGLLYLFLQYQTASFATLQLVNFSLTENNLLFYTFLIGFGVKLPIWPFYGWLPKAHVEASTNFSIFLSGVLVKFAFLGLLKLTLYLGLEPSLFILYPLLLVGIVDAVFKLFFQIDLKKVVAYSTVIEMHWLTLCLVSNQSGLLLSGFCMLIAHAILSSNSFLIVDSIGRRYKSRLITEISGIGLFNPKLFLVSLINLLIFLGFPGSLLFVSEIMFFTFLLDLFPAFTLILILLLYLFGPTFFFRAWLNTMFGLSKYQISPIPADLTKVEILIFSFLIILMYFFGLSWQTLLF